LKTICHVCDNLGIGGAQSMLFELYLAIEKYHSSDYTQIVITSANRPTAKSFISSYNVPYVEMKNQSQIIDRITTLKNPIVFFHKLASSNYKTLQELKKKKIPVIAINHTLFNDRLWSKADSSCCDIIVSVSDHMDKHVRKWYPKIKKYTYIHNGVNQYRYDEIRGKNKDKSILKTGRINRMCGWKHSESWIQWVKDVKLPQHMSHSYIGGRIGSGDQKGKTRIIRGKNDVLMLGNIPDFKEKVSLIKQWDLFLYETNREEGISMAILESLASGVPVICSNHFGNKEIIEQGINGYIFKDKGAAKNILKDLCKHRDKLELLKKTTKEHFANKLDAKYTAKRYIELAEKILSKKLTNGVSEISVNIKKKNKDKKKRKKENKKKFTIISSCHNKGKYLEDWINSILVQKYRPLEVIIANDVSTDNSFEILKNNSIKFKEKGIEFKIINNLERLYCGSSYHNLVQYITGSFVGVVDSDDMLVDDAVEYIMGVYNKNPEIAWIYTQFDIYDMNMNKKRRGFCSVPSKGENLLELGRRRIHGYGHWRTFNNQIKRPDKLFCKGLKCGVDKFMGYRLEEFGLGMFVDRVCYKYRQYPVGFKESVSSTKEAIKSWQNIINSAVKRRKKYNYKPYNIKKI